MKKVLFFCSIIVVMSYSQLNFATNSSVPHETNKIVTEQVVSGQKETSTATIGFSEKRQTDQGNETILKGRLPTTGESVGIGLSLLGLVLIIIIFRQELKEMIKNKKRNKGEESK